MLAGIDKQPEMTSEKKLIPLEKYNMRLMSFGFINAENAPVVWRGPMVSRMTQQFFEDVEWGELDYLILDLPPGTGDIQLTLVQKLALTGSVMVTTPQNLALLDVKKGADMFAKVNTPVLGVIENMTHFLCPHCNEASQIFPGTSGKEESKRLDVPFLGQIYLSPEIAQSADDGIPYVLKYENSSITQEYINIASQLKELSEK
jgi:ATP-binding protein involved in chromosome partitioning